MKNSICATFLLSISVIKEGFGAENLTLEKLDGEHIRTFEHPNYVDKTLMLKAVMEGEKNLLLLAPNRFGKTLNTHMLKHFFSIPSHSKVKIKTLEIFRSLKINKEYPDFVEQNFGKFPVMYLNFKIYCKTLHFNHMHLLFSQMVEETLQKHSYLKFSPMLKQSEREMFKRWCNDGRIFMTGREIDSALDNLLYFLHRHHDRKIFLIIDDFDATIKHLKSKANSVTKEDSSVVSYLQRQLTKLISQQDFLEKVVVTGVSGESARDCLSHVVHYRFLEDHRYTEYHGFTEAEVRQLIMKNDIDDVGLDEIRRRYGGYTTINNMTLYNPCYVFNYMQGRVVTNYGVHSGDFRGEMFDFLKSHLHLRIFISLYMGKPTRFQYQKGVPIFNTKQMLSLHMFLIFLIEQGYVAWGPVGYVHTPNTEMKNEILSILLKLVYAPIKNRYKHGAIIQSIIRQYNLTSLIEDGMKLKRGIFLRSHLKNSTLHRK